MQGGRGRQVAYLPSEGRFLQFHPLGDIADQNLPPVGVVTRVDEPAVRVSRQALGHRPARGGVVGAADDQTAAVVWEAGIAVPVGLDLVLSEWIDRVAHGTPVGFGQTVGESLALELSDILGVEVLAQQVVGFHPVVVDQDDGSIPPLEEAAETLGDEAAGAAAADHCDPGVVQKEGVIQVVWHWRLPPCVVRLC